MASGSWLCDCSWQTRNGLWLGHGGQRGLFGAGYGLCLAFPREPVARLEIPVPVGPGVGGAAAITSLALLGPTKGLDTGDLYLVFVFYILIL